MVPPGAFGVETVLLLWRADGADKENKLVVIGEKGRAQLSRDQKDTILETIADLGKSRFTFSQVRMTCLASRSLPRRCCRVYAHLVYLSTPLIPTSTLSL